MNYNEAFELMSSCKIGAILLDNNNIIIDCNDVASILLLDNSAVTSTEKDILINKHITDLLPDFSFDSDENEFVRVSFKQYVKKTIPPDIIDIPESAFLITFRDATTEMEYELLRKVAEQLKVSITIWDTTARMMYINSSAMRLEGHLRESAIGKYNETLYEPRNDTMLVIPEILKTGKCFLDLRQDFNTAAGKELQIYSNNYPLYDNNQMIGAVSIMEDWSNFDYLKKKIIQLQSQLLDKKESRTNNTDSYFTKYNFNSIVYSTEVMRTTVERCKQFAKSDSSIMIYGETGTGKELIAQSIHSESPRAKGPFIDINCAAIPDTLLESILFGTEKGAYTGATQTPGLMEQADGGTLLLDELNSLNPSLQSKLLRVLQEGHFRRIGGTNLIRVNVRFLSNLNVQPEEAIANGQLRNDLFYRLGVINIKVPPLRERKEDIFLLVKNFIINLNEKLSKAVINIDNECRSIFYSYDWPGNVRELQHAIEYAMNILPDSYEYITPQFLPDNLLREGNYASENVSATSFPQGSVEEVMNLAGKNYIEELLSVNDQNISKTARMLGISRQNLQHKMKALHVTQKSKKG